MRSDARQETTFESEHEKRQHAARGHHGPRQHRGEHLFDRFAAAVSRWAGSPSIFTLAVLLVLVWAVSGPFFGFSAVWQLVINTGTTIVTFLMVFLIQQSQNKDSKAVHLKLDELLVALKGASEKLVDIEHLDERQLSELGRRYSELARKTDEVAQATDRRASHE